MKATALDVTSGRAVIELRPCWPARLLGAKTTIVELERGKHDNGESGHWVAVATQRRLGWLPYSREIEHALDFRPVQSPPVARLLP